MPYATYENLAAAVDANLIADCCADTGGPLPGPNSVATYALEQASARIRAMARTASIYTDSQLDAMAAASDPMLVGITVNLAAYWLLGRRGGAVPPHHEALFRQALSDLEALRDGKMIFGAVDTAAQAGLATVQAVGTMLPTQYGASYASAFYPRISNNTYPNP